MTDTDTILRTAHSVLVVDWPTKALPETLSVPVRGLREVGPRARRLVTYEAADDGSIRRHRIGRPDRVDLVHVYRPIDELAAFVELARDLGASIVWVRGLAADGTRDPAGCWLSAGPLIARGLVEAAGLVYVDHPSILDAVRTAGIGGTRAGAPK